jgi:hypothetical protein
VSAKKKQSAEWPIGTRVWWKHPPIVRVGAHGFEPALSRFGVVTMNINGSAIVRFLVDGGRESEPFEPVSMADAERG